MKAVFFPAKNEATAGELPDPVAGPGEVLVKVRASGICHTDFEVKKGKRVIVGEIRNKYGKYAFVSAIKNRNGVFCKTNLKPNQSANVITVNYDGNGGVAIAFYHDKPFWALDSVNVLYPKFKLNPFIAMFLITLIRKERYRFNFGRKWHKARMEQSTILLPVNEKNFLFTPFFQHRTLYQVMLKENQKSVTLVLILHSPTKIHNYLIIIKLGFEIGQE